MGGDNGRADLVLEVSGVRKRYGTAAGAALDGVDLEVGAGEFVAVMGPSGSGKSTLLNLVAGLDRPSEGRVVVGNVDLGKLGEGGLARYRRTQLGFVFQFFHLLEQMTALENVALPAQLGGRRHAEERARELLERLGVGDKAKEYPGRLSGGERQRVAIARALVNEPRLLLADEPTGALDSANGEQVMELLRELNGGGQTILQVTHDLALAERYASRLVLIRDGRLLPFSSEGRVGVGA
jgi:putative ABC transport system ATP-binding protein